MRKQLVGTTHRETVHYWFDKDTGICYKGIEVMTPEEAYKELKEFKPLLEAFDKRKASK